MAFAVAGGAAEFEFVGGGVAGLFVWRVVVVVEELGAAAVAAFLVSFFDEAFLAGGGVAASVAGVDGSGFGVVDEGS